MPNRLGAEPSPYLRLHASNPVDWYAWGEEAFARARALDRPIFLSIGYYTCHWCHVMERESFADQNCATLLNHDFVSIKVDREERPDVDRLYMTYVQAVTGGGGWPLSAFLTPDLQPFYGGTYFPSRSRHGMPSFSAVLEAIARAWKEERPRLLSSAAEASRMLAQLAPTSPEPRDGTSPERLFAHVWPQLFQELRASFDSAHGGFGAAPKFPRPAVLAFLQRYAYAHRGSEDGDAAQQMVTTTLRAMATGGIHDALGGGFHRYATDAAWRVPHFEKMLYDQAQLAVAYLEAWQATHAPELAANVRTTCDYVLREMRQPPGFFSAQDADSAIPETHRRPGGPSEGEGAYYLWTQAEIEALLPPGMAQAFCARYGVLPQGNVPRQLDPQGEFEGRNILYVAAPGGAADEEALAEARARLYAARRQRPLPPTDDKILTAWNGLMISALARAGAALEERHYVDAARAAASWLWAERWQAAKGELRRTPTVAGMAEDYAFMVQALLDLHQADFDPRWLEWARDLQRAQDAQFAAPGGGYFSGGEDPHLWLRLREDYDGAEPSPNSVTAANLLRLDLWFEGEDFRAQAERLLASFASRLEQMPQALPLMAGVLKAAAAPPRRLQIAGLPENEKTRLLLRTARRQFLPGYWVMLAAPPSDTQAAAYLCEDYTCQLPIHDPETLERALVSGSR